MRKSRQISDLSLTSSDRRGLESEDRIEKALQNLAADGEIYMYIRSDPYDTYDSKGIDFFIFPEEDWAIPLQVKSSFEGRRVHIDIHNNRIPCVVVLREYDDAALKQIILQVLGLYVGNILPDPAPDPDPAA